MVRNEKGVTLVELLIVIVILGIIAAISVPAVGNIVSNAEKDAVISDAKNIKEAVNLHCTSESDPSECTNQDDGSGDAIDGADFFGSVGDGVDLIGEGYLEGFSEDYEYLAWYSSTDDEFKVAIYDTEGEYYFVGNPDDGERGLVEEDAAEPGWMDEQTGDFPEDTTSN